MAEPGPRMGHARSQLLRLRPDHLPQRLRALTPPHANMPCDPSHGKKPTSLAASRPAHTTSLAGTTGLTETPINLTSGSAKLKHLYVGSHSDLVEQRLSLTSRVLRQPAKHQ